MNRNVVLFGLSSAAIGAAAALTATISTVAGCSSGSSSPGMSSSTSSGGSSGGTTAPTCNKGPLLIDDMTALHTSGAGIPGGYWFPYDDQTNPYSEPALKIMTPDGGLLPGTMNPDVGSHQWQPTDPTMLMLPAGLPGGRRVSGGGQMNWGAGIGFDIESTKPDGGNNVPFWACDGGAPGQVAAGGPQVWSDAPDSGNGIPVPFDASAHKGVSFYAISFTPNAQSVQVKFSEHRTNAWAGVCDVCTTKLYNPQNQCGDDYLLNVQFPAGQWQQFTIHWTDLKTQNWTKKAYPPGGFDPTSWYSMHFQFHTSAGVPLPMFDVGVACIEFVDN